MKKLFIGSGILLALLVIMAFTGLTEHEDRKKAAFNEGNLQYAAGNYEQAVKLYNEAPEKLDRYLNSGNASYKLGEAAKDAQQKLPFYQEAVKTYKLGILKFPENVALKYNYEYVLKKLESQQQDQEKQDSDKSDDKKDENQDKQDGQQPSPSPQPDKQDGQQPSPSGQPDKQDGQQPSPSGQPDKQDGQQPSPSGQPDKQDGQQSSQAEQGDKSSPSPGGESSAQSGLSDQELEQVMGMLEKQEEESLKNNQEIKKEDKGEAYDW